MAIQDTDQLAINRDGVDYKVTVSDLSKHVCQTCGGGGGEPGWKSLKWYYHVIVPEDGACTVTMERAPEEPRFEVWNVSTGEQWTGDSLKKSSRKKRKNKPEATASGFDGGGYYYYYYFEPKGVRLPKGQWIVGFRDPAPYEWDDPWARSLKTRPEDVASGFDGGGYDNTKDNDSLSFRDSDGDFKIGVLTNTFETEGMHELFLFCSKFTNMGSAFPPGFMTDNVVTMNKMFATATRFNVPVNHLNTSKVLDLHKTFESCPDFNQPINRWDVSSVIDMEGTFKSCNKFNQHVDWKCDSCINMSEMFKACRSFEGKSLRDLKFDKVESMFGMFQDCDVFNYSELGSSWWGWADDRLKSVKVMDYMFFRALAFNQDISGWCVENVDSEPDKFREYSPLTDENCPVWGTCPNG